MVDLPDASGERVLGSELRIHGIGNHAAYSALGSPITDDGQALERSDNTPAIVRPMPPSRTPHPVWLLAWTRWSRSLNSPAWYMGLPFTLCNAAGEMGPTGKAGAILRGLVSGIGVLLTLGAYFWSLVVAEAVMIKLYLPDEIWGCDIALVILVLVTLIWCLLLARRAAAWRMAASDQAPGARGWAVVHLVAVAAAGITIGILKPAEGTRDWTPRDGTPTLIEWADWSVVLAWSTIAVTALIVVVTAAASVLGKTSNWAGQPAAPALGVGITLFAAAVVLHVAGSLVALLADWVALYVSGHTPLHGDPAGIHRAEPLLRSFDYAALPYSARDTLAAPLVVIGWLAVAVLIVLWVVKRLGQLVGGPAVGRRRSEHRARLVHNLIARPTRRGFPLAVLALVVAMASVTALTMWSLHSNLDSVLRGEELRCMWDVLDWTFVGGLHLLMVLLPFALLSSGLRATIAVASDVVGYWPNATHPLAAPPYRFVTLNAAVDHAAHLARPVVVVGHSQGSVLGAELVKRLADRGWARDELALVTCGSPLASLYSAYFPCHFPPEERVKIRESVATWVNFWRGTDPISTEMAPHDNDVAGSVQSAGGLPADVELADGDARPAGRALRVHSDYWLEAEQVAAVESAVRGEPAPSAT